MPADAAGSVPAAHVEERELRDAGTNVRCHDADPDEPLGDERSQRERATGEMPRALGALMRD